MLKTLPPLICLVSAFFVVESFSPWTVRPRGSRHSANVRRQTMTHTPPSLQSTAGAWDGSVASNTQDGRIQGCKLAPAKEGATTEWLLVIDGNEADLGRFSEAIYKKIMTDAKQQRFQGFRPGTIPPHLLPTYKAYAMDECARETVLEALQQNNVRPFESCRLDMELGNFQIPPAAVSKKKRKKKGGRKNKRNKGAVPESDDVGEDVSEPEPEPQWRTFETMKEAISAGWKPGQSFSFMARNVKGQRVKSEVETGGAEPIVREGLF